MGVKVLDAPGAGCYRPVMLTTSQLLLLLDFGYTACPEGRAFADAHPDPAEAISYALAHARRDPAVTTSMGSGSGRNDPGAFLRWAASDAAYSAYYELGPWGQHITAHLEGCARILRAWVAKMQAKHAEAQRAVYAVQQALEAQCIGGEPVRVFPAGPRATEVRS